MEIFSLKNRNILVTGGAGLLGKKHVEAILMAGGNPIVFDNSKISLDCLYENILKNFNFKLDVYEVDITNEIEIKEIANHFEKNEFIINGIVNNAALNPTTENLNLIETRVEKYSINDWRNTLEVELTGSFLMLKHFGFLMYKQGLGGVILNISSDLGLISPDQRLYKDKNKSTIDQKVKPISYSVSKAGIIGLTKYMATYWADQNIRCNALCPGGVYTNDMSEEFLTRIENLIPMKRMANLNEYQGTLIWAMSEASSYLNGAVIPIDGGRSVW